ncbi:MAG: hypothetical protein HY298_06240 [Verrucomicrobia bacterium]|nr:hypothetical protein [Verrucomicrobiota bacterium]
MNPYPLRINGRWLRGCASLVCLLGCAFGSLAAPPKAPATAVVTNPPPEHETAFPKSEFDERGGKDPFFPLRSITPVEKPKPGAAAGAGYLVLQGFSGTVSQPLAIINGRTFGIGEEGDVPTPAGKVKIRCLEIRPPVSVAVEIVSTGEHRELRKGL